MEQDKPQQDSCDCGIVDGSTVLYKIERRDAIPSNYEIIGGPPVIARTTGYRREIRQNTLQHYKRVHSIYEDQNPIADDDDAGQVEDLSDALNRLNKK